MDRLEFKSDRTGIPVASGTNYSRIINIRNSVDTKADPNKGPYSSLFNYDQEEADLKTQNEKKQKVQQKIMKTNAVGEAFRLLIEGVGAFGGATITPRNVNPGILSAVSEYAKNEDEYMQRLEGLKNKKLVLKQADLQYSLGQNAASLDKAEKQAERSHQESIQAEKEVDNYIRELRLQENQYRLRGMENEAVGVQKQIQMGEQTALEIALARKKEQFSRGMDLTGGGASTGIDVLTPPKSDAQRQQQSFVVPDIKKEIFLNQGMTDYIRTQLQTGRGKYDQSVPQVLRDAMNNKNLQPEAVMTVISENWDYIRDNVLSPDVYKQIYGVEPGQEQKPSATQVTNAPPKQAKQEDGSVDLDENSQLQLLGRIKETLNNTSFADNKKLGTIKEFVYSTYQAAGLSMSQFDAENISKEYLRQWRAQQKALKETAK